MESKETKPGHRASSVSIQENPARNGIELYFDAEPAIALQAKLRVMEFRPGKKSLMWYADNTEQTKSFAEQLHHLGLADGPPMLLSPSFEAIKSNIESKHFSYVFITLKDGQVKHFIVFEPSKPKAEVIAGNYARENYGELFLALAVKPKTYLREARALFDGGNIIFSDNRNAAPHKEMVKIEAVEKVQETPKEDLWETHRQTLKTLDKLKKRVMSPQLKMQPYHSIYNKLNKIIPDLLKHIEQGKDHGKSQLKSSGMMDLNFDYLGKDKNGNYLLALSHYYEQNGDLVADPDMQIRIIPEMQAAEAMTFQDTYSYKEVYEEREGKEYVNLYLKKDLNRFLNQWLTNIIQQGHKIDLSKAEKETEETEEPEEKSDYSPKAYEQLIQLIPDLPAHLKKGTAAGELISEDKDGIQRKIQYTFYPQEGEEPYRIGLNEYIDGTEELQSDINIEPSKQQASVTAEWLSFHYSEKYDREESEDAIDDRGGDIEEEMTRGLTEWLDDVLSLGYRIQLSETKPEEITPLKTEDETDPLSNHNGVFTEATAGSNMERVEIPMPKTAQFKAEVSIVKTSKGDYRTGISAHKLFGDFSGMSSPASLEGQIFSTREGALKHALKYLELRLEVMLIQKDSILNNEEKKTKQLNAALNALKEFAKSQDIEIEETPESIKPQIENNSIQKTVETPAVIKELEPAYWTEEDENDSEAFKITIDGIAFHALTLQELLLEKIKKISMDEQFAIANRLAEEFNLIALSDYKTGNGSTIRDGGDALKIQVMHEYFLDMGTKHDFYNPPPSQTIFKFLIDALIDKQETLVDKPVTGNHKKVIKKKQSPLELNKEIEAFIDQKDQEASAYTEADKNYIRQYSGSGGLIKQGATGRGVLYEYYTPEEVVKKMWGLAFKYGYTGGKVLEPAAGTGNFLKYAPQTATIVGYETSHYSARIAQVLYPHATIYEKPFETNFFAGNIHLKDNFENPGFELAIGNPPYGEFTGKYAGMGEKQWTSATEYDQYFITRSLDLLKPGGLLVFIIPSSFLSYNVKSARVKEKISKKIDFIDAYRLPVGTFNTTDIGTDIIVFRKK